MAYPPVVAPPPSQGGMLRYAQPSGSSPCPDCPSPSTTFTTLLHFDGADGDTNTTEPHGRLVENTSAARIRTAQSKFGGSSLGTSFASGGFVRTSHDAMAVDFTAGIWFRWDGTTGASKALFTMAGGWELYLDSSGKLGLWSGASTLFTAGSAVSANTWHLAVIERHSGLIRGTIDGASVGTSSTSTRIDAGQLIIGNYTSGAEPFTGYLDEAFICPTSAYFGGGTFTPPTSAFT